MVTRGGGSRPARSSQRRPLYDVLKDSALRVDGEEGMFVVLDKAVLDELRVYPGRSTTRPTFDLIRYHATPFIR